MNNGEIIGKVHNSMYHQIKGNGIATPVQVLMELGILSKQDYENWRFGKVQYLEKVCKTNLNKLSFIMKEIQSYAQRNNIKGSCTYYKQWGIKDKKVSVKLRFSKTNTEHIEKCYATHYINSDQISEINKQKNDS